MEKLFNGRAIFIDNFNTLEISFPKKKYWYILLLLGSWLCGWVVGEIAVLGIVTGMIGGMGQGQFYFFLGWLILWTLGGIFAFRIFFWNLMGKEIIIIGEGQLTIERKGTFLLKLMTYQLNEAKNFRIQQDHNNYFGSFYSGRRNDFWTPKAGGTICFDSGTKTIKFAVDVDEEEAKLILQKLKDKRILTEKNF